ELERRGFIYTMTGKGCFVAPFHPNELDDKRTEIVEARIKKDVADYKELGLSLDEIKKLFEKLY
ncbi:MAG: GntR family transcriptional regulator, partial [Ruminococcaceae bacterium]|nr:GntR family transcriptional regulator [Oscillospiraceae bacterium]